MDIREDFSKLNSIVRANLLGIFSMCTDTGIINFSADSVERLVVGQGLNYADFVDQMHQGDKAAATTAFKSIIDGTWPADASLVFRLPAIGNKYELLSMKVVYDEDGTALGGITDYSSSVHLFKLNTLALESSFKYTFYYDFKTSKITFNDDFIRDYGLPNDSTENVLQWVNNCVVDDEHQGDLLCAMSKVASGESDIIDIRLKILHGVARAMHWLHMRGKVGRDGDGKADVLAGSILDITQQVNADERTNLILEGSADCVFVFDLEHDVYEFSSKIYNLAPLRSRILQNGLEAWLNFIVPDDRAIFEAAIERIISGQSDNFKVEFRLKGRGSSPFWVSCSGKCSFGDKGQPKLVAGSLINLENIHNFSQYMDESINATRSSGLPNRTAFYQDLEAIIADANDDELKALGHILAIDIDGFGSINSLHGMLVGDRMLLEYGTLLAMLVPDKGKLYHFSNNLFVMYSPETDEEKIKKFSEQVRKYSASGLLVEDIHLVMTVSVGVASFVSADKIEDILVNAELALRRAKKLRNTVGYFEPEHRTSYLARLSLESELAESIASNFRGFEIFYQPFYSIAFNAFVGAEALLRWRNAQGEIVSPGVVIPALQSMGIFSEVESWVFRMSAAQCVKWIKMTGNQDFSINVNMSPQRASSGNLTNEVQTVMAEHGLELHNMFLELTEEGVVMSSASNIQTLVELSNLGARISLDDFGTGYSSLGHLRHLPICELKIDRSFVTDIVENQTSRNFLGAMINLSHIMNYIVCIEGVETLEQLRIAARLNADIVQGFYFSPPVPAAVMEEKFITNINCPEAFEQRHKDIWQ